MHIFLYVCMYVHLCVHACICVCASMIMFLIDSKNELAIYIVINDYVLIGCGLSACLL
jgi:hypothetical protein